jgi:hypothetical protein
LAEIFDRQAHELVAARFELHPLEQLARFALVCGSRVRELADVLHAPGEAIALALELREAQQSRAAESLLADPRCIDGDVRKRAGDGLRELTLESRNLPTQ